jgi:hypothetical protein
MPSSDGAPSPGQVPDNEEEEARELGPARGQKVREAEPDEARIQQTRASIARLLHVAGGDTGESLIAADFLLAWWNARECGGFDLADLWSVDQAIAEDMIVVFSTLPNWRHYPDSETVGLKTEFRALVTRWRPGPGASK